MISCTEEESVTEEEVEIFFDKLEGFVRFNRYDDDSSFSYYISSSKLPSELEYSDFQEAVHLAINEWESLSISFYGGNLRFREVESESEADFIFQFANYTDLENLKSEFESIGRYVGSFERDNLGLAWGPYSSRFPEMKERNLPTPVELEFVREEGYFPQFFTKNILINSDPIACKNDLICSPANWEVDPISVRNDGRTYDLVAVLIHEIGHAIGYIDHNINTASVMFKKLRVDDEGNYIRQITGGDIEILKRSYPEFSTGKIRGIEVETGILESDFLVSGVRRLEVRGKHMPFDMEVWLDNLKLENLRSDLESHESRFFSLPQNIRGRPVLKVYQDEGEKNLLFQGELDNLFREGILGINEKGNFVHIDLSSNIKTEVSKPEIDLTLVEDADFDTHNKRFTFYRKEDETKRGSKDPWGVDFEFHALVTFDIFDGLYSAWPIRSDIKGLNYISDGRLLGLLENRLVRLGINDGSVTDITPPINYQGKSVEFGEVINEDEGLYLFLSAEDLLVIANYETGVLAYTPLNSNAHTAFYNSLSGEYIYILDDHVGTIDLESGSQDIRIFFSRYPSSPKFDYFYDALTDLFYYGTESSMEM